MKSLFSSFIKYLISFLARVNCCVKPIGLGQIVMFGLILYTFLFFLALYPGRETQPVQINTSSNAPYENVTDIKAGSSSNGQPNEPSGLIVDHIQLGDDLILTQHKPDDLFSEIFEHEKLLARLDSDDDGREARPDQPDRALEFRLMQMKDENGQIPEDGLFKARRHVDEMRAAMLAKAYRVGKQPAQLTVAGLVPADWVWLGPGNVGGRIRSIVIDPNNSNNIWVGSVGGGIWKSTDAGNSWAPVNDFMANLAVSTMAIDPTNSSTMYAGTGEAFSNIREIDFSGNYGIRGAGVFKSIDGGQTWNQIGSTDPGAADPPGCAGAVGATPCQLVWRYVKRLAISPDSTTVLAATHNGIMRSTDGGVTWTVRSTANVLDVDFRPGDPSQAIAGELASARFSTDSGQTWSAATFIDPVNFPAGVTTIPLSANNNGRIEVAYSQSNPNVVYASVNNNNGEIYASSDGGQNFTLVSSGKNFFLGSNNQGGYDNAIWVSPQNPSLIVVGGIDLWRSTDGGNNFTQISRWQCGPVTTGGCTGQSAHADQHVIVAAVGFDGVNNKRVYFGNDGGIFRTDDITSVCDTVATPSCQTSGWTDLNRSLGITQFYGGSANPIGKIIAGAQDNSTLLYSGDVQNWSTVVQGDGGFTAADPGDPNYLYGEAQNLNLFRSSDGGSTQSSIINGITETCGPGAGCTPTVNFIAPFVLDPNNSNTMLAGGQNLWRSSDVKTSQTPNWNTIWPETTASPTPTPAPTPISAIAVAKGNSDLIVFGRNDGLIYLTQNGTTANPSWARINNGTPARFVNRLYIDNNHSPVWIYAAFGGFSADNLWRSVDLGAHWTNVSGTGATALPSVPVRGIAVSLVNPNLIYVGTEVGIFASDDAGTTWQVPQSGPANVSVDDLVWDDGNLVAVTHGRGIYETHTPIFITSSGANHLCTGPPNCQCFGEWTCPCNWPNNLVPGQNDDVYVSCPMSVSFPGADVRNLNVADQLTLTGGSVHAGQLLYNGWAISGSGDVAAADILNFGTLGGTNVTANNLTNSGPISVSGDMHVENGNLANNYSMQGVNLFLGAPITAPSPGIVSGSGEFNFQGALIRAGNSAALGSTVNFQIRTFTNNGIFDVRDHNVTFNGSLDSFSDDSRFRGVIGTGTVQFAPTTINNQAHFYVSKQFTPPVRVLSGIVNGTVFDSLNGVPAALGGLTVDGGATFTVDSTATIGGDILLNGPMDVASTCAGCTTRFTFNGGIFTNNAYVGPISFFTFNDTTLPKSQQIAGLGGWSPINVSVGANTTLNAQNGLIFGSSQFTIPQSSMVDISNKTLVFSRPVNVFLNGKIAGPLGTVKFDPTSGSPRIDGSGATFEPTLEVASGTLSAIHLAIGAKLYVDSGATLNLADWVSVGDDLRNDGTITSTAGQTLNFLGSKFTNNGNVGGGTYTVFGASFGGPATQSIAGTGTWTGAQNMYVYSNTSLLNDVTYDGSGVWIYNTGGLDTGSNTLTVPCAATFGDSSSYTGELVGNIRRINIPSCSGSIAFGNNFTSISFTGGSAPNDVLVNLTKAAPGGFPNAINRSYMITPNGGSGWNATLRLHYLDTELNGNNESSLSLFRNDGTSWNLVGVTNRDTVNNWVEYSGVTQFSPWALSSNSGPSTTPTPTPTPTPTVTPTATPTVTPTPTPTPTPASPVSQITVSTASCAQFVSGTAATLSSAQYAIKTRNNTISSVTPSTIVYWLRVDAIAGSNSVVIDQAITTGNFSQFWNIPKGSTIFNSNCGSTFKGTFSQAANGSTMVTWKAPSNGSYIIMLKLGSSNFTRQSVPNPSTVHFDFSSTRIAGSMQGIDLVGPAGIAELFPYTFDDWSANFLDAVGRRNTESLWSSY